MGGKQLGASCGGAVETVALFSEAIVSHRIIREFYILFSS